MAKQRDFFGIVLPAVPDRAPARRGWTTWQKGLPQFRLWWPVVREANWLKRNLTEYFDAAGELVAEERWGINGESWRMKKPAPGQDRIPHDPEAIERAAEAFRSQKARERAERAREAARAVSEGKEV